jgi:hypothetical protein
VTGHRATNRLLRRLVARLERERRETLAESSAGIEWRVGFCDGLRAAQELIRKGG